MTTECAINTEDGELIAYNHLPTQGKPVPAGRQGLREIQGRFPTGVRVFGVCTTDSVRYPAGVIVGADVVKN